MLADYGPIRGVLWFLAAVFAGILGGVITNELLGWLF